MAEPGKFDEFKTKVQKLIVKEKSFIDGTIREKGEVVDIVLGRAHHKEAHSNLEPYSPEAKKRIDAELEEEAAGADNAPKPVIKNSAQA